MITDVRQGEPSLSIMSFVILILGDGTGFPEARLLSTGIGVGVYPSFAASNSASVISEGKACAEPSSSVSRKDLDG